MRRVQRTVAVCVVSTVVLASTAIAETEPYRDEKGTNPLRIISYVVQPIGTLIEWAIFRPLHAVGSRIAPERKTIPRPTGECRRERPSRLCTDVVE